MKRSLSVLSLVIALSVLLTGCHSLRGGDLQAKGDIITLDTLPEFSDSPYVSLYENIPSFDKKELKTQSFEEYSPLDALGRCGEAFAIIGRDLMPTEERGSIGSVKPSGWQTVKYDIVEGKYLYNRCHLIGFQLSGENANVCNLITGTRYMNVSGMLPFENMVADYVKETDNHVLYRVTPIFKGANLLADGVQIEALSVEDEGEGIEFNVFCYNAQPGIIIDYSSGTSRLEGDEVLTDSSDAETENRSFIINKSSKKFHLPSCSGASKISDKNKESFEGGRDELLGKGYTACGTCKP